MDGENDGTGKDNRAESVTDAEWSAAIAAMAEAGRKAGYSAGTWVVDGNTSDKTLRALLEQMEDGDFGADQSGPFSGEWADGLTVHGVISAETELDAESLSDEEQSELANVFEDAYWQAFHDEAERSVRAMLGDE